MRIDPRYYRIALREAHEANDSLPALPKEVRRISKRVLRGGSITTEEFNQLSQAEKLRGIKFYRVVERNRVRLGKPSNAVRNRYAITRQVRAKYDGMPTIVVSHSDTEVSDDGVDAETK